MPTYEYECTKCGFRFERFQGITEAPRKRCPECRCRVKRLIGSGAGILFKGSGFHETDYRSASYREGEKKEKPTPPAKGDKKKDGGKSTSSGAGKTAGKKTKQE